MYDINFAVLFLKLKIWALKDRICMDLLTLNTFSKTDSLRDARGYISYRSFE